MKGYIIFRVFVLFQVHGDRSKFNLQLRNRFHSDSNDDAITNKKFSKMNANYVLFILEFETPFQ